MGAPIEWDDTRVYQTWTDALPFNGEETRVVIEVDGHHEVVSMDPLSADTDGDEICNDQGPGTLAGSGDDDVVSDRRRQIAMATALLNWRAGRCRCADPS